MVKKGFTLIELLIVIAILGVLATIVTMTFPSALGRARDGQRRSDIKQYQIALEKYANNNNGNYYVSSTAMVGLSTLCTNLGLSNCSQDPKSPTLKYVYQTNATGTTYVLSATFERPVDATKPCFIVCSNGLSGDKNCQTSSCPLP